MNTDDTTTETTVTYDVEEYEPPTDVVTPRARTTIYIVLLVVNVLAFLALSILPVWDIIDADRAGRTLAYVLNGIGLVSAALNIGYRPTRT